jgi:hypothetical protein
VVIQVLLEVVEELVYIPEGRWISVFNICLVHLRLKMGLPVVAEQVN